MNLRAVFLDARLWRYILRELSQFVEAVGIKFHPSEGVRLKAMDPSHVALVDLSIPSTAFEEYDVNEESTLIIPLESVSKILRRAGRSDKLMIASDGLKLTVGLISRGNTERIFTLPLLPGSYEEIPELSLEFDVQAKTTGITLAVSLSILEDVGDVLKIKVYKEGISLISASELGEAEIALTIPAGTLIDYQSPQDIEEFVNAYSMEYLSMLSTISKMAETVTIKLGRDIPCEFDLDLTSGSILKFYVAPRSE
ncbi:MAG: hypothetical protein QXR37_05735 [Ignisphaera sp.]